jgi:hypothetical protein
MTKPRISYFCKKSNPLSSITWQEKKMIKKLIVMTVLLLALLLSACGASQETQTPVEEAVSTPTAETAATPTIDPCQPEYQRVLAERVNYHMREFDDASTLASSLNMDTLPSAIAELQRIRRAAEDEPVPACLDKLKGLQVSHMNAVINTLIGFLNSVSTEELQKGILEARQLHDSYAMELASIFGVTVTAPTTPAINVPPVSATQPAGLYITNPGPDAVTLLSAPDVKAGGVAMLEAGLTTIAYGKTADGLWIQVEVPGLAGQKAWASSSSVQVSGEPPVVTP